MEIIIGAFIVGLVGYCLGAVSGMEYEEAKHKKKARARAAKSRMLRKARQAQ